MNQSSDHRKQDALWPEAFDAMIAAADIHRRMIANDQVRVLDTKVAPGDTVPLHTHYWPSVLVCAQFQRLHPL